jgi:hypothetical protein
LRETKFKTQKLEERLIQIRSKLGKIIVCTIGVTETGFDILHVKTVVPLNAKENLSIKKQTTKHEKNKNRPFMYIG